MLRAAILTIGDEIITGHIIDTNAAWLSSELADRNVEVVKRISLPDDQSAIAQTLLALCDSVDVILVSGGLGPTLDDITRFALADALQEPMVTDEMALERLQSQYRKAGQLLPESNVVQVQHPQSTRLIPNTCGTAPGISAHLPNDTEAFFVPGVPRELKAMWSESILPTVESMLEDRNAEIACVRLVHCASYSEGKLGDQLADLMTRGANPLVATLPSDSLVTVRIRATGPTIAQAQQCADDTANEVAARLQNCVFGFDETTLADAVLQQLRHRSGQLAIAESCTAGLLGKMLTDSAGASDVLAGGWITYSNAMKTQCLDVPEEMINEYGAVSSSVAQAMAIGAAAKANVAFGLSITGIAGPGGGTKEKPVGTVHIGLADQRQHQGEPCILQRRFKFSGSRDSIRMRAALTAQAMLFFYLQNRNRNSDRNHSNADLIPPLLWQRD